MTRPVFAEAAISTGSPERPISDGQTAVGSYRILIADDNRDAADSLCMLLQLLGNEVRVVSDGIQAFDEAARFLPDLAILDIGMPKLNGHDVARQIRAQAWGRSMILAALTGWGQEEDKRRTAEAGFDRHFTKPVNPAAIERFVAELRDRKIPQERS